MKGKSIAKIAVALAVIVLAALLALFGLKIPPISEVYGIKSLGAAIETGLELGGGYAAEYTAVGASAEELDAAVEIMRERLTAMGYDDATASRAGDNGIRIEFPDVTDAESLASMLGMAGHMQMLDSSGNVILDGSNVDSVSVGYTQDGHASVNFDFDDEGTDCLLYTSFSSPGTLA